MKNQAQFSALASLLESPELSEDCLDFIEAHGYITASLISPNATELESLIEEVSGQQISDLSPEALQTLRDSLPELEASISKQLLLAEPIDLPCEMEAGDEAEVSDIERWCMAFVEKHLLDSEAWFEGEDPEHEIKIAELLLPMMSAAEVFDDEEILAFKQQPEIYLSMLENIPEVVVDLYAIYHSK